MRLGLGATLRLQSNCCTWPDRVRDAANGGVTVSTGLVVAERHAGVWAPVIAYKTTIANNNLALAA